MLAMPDRVSRVPIGMLTMDELRLRGADALILAAPVVWALARLLQN